MVKAGTQLTPLSGQRVTIHLRKVKEPPFAVHGTFEGTTQYHDRGAVLYVVNGEVGETIGKKLFIPENLIHYIEAKGEE
jgi:hypothetical protein